MFSPLPTIKGGQITLGSNQITHASIKDGKPIKYESPRGQPNQIYLPPGVVEKLSDPEQELLITEGEKKSLCASQYEFPCIGLVGVFGWKETKSESLIPQLKRVAWKGRKVYIVFDSDISENENVQDAESRLAYHLQRRGAIVKVVRLPVGLEQTPFLPRKEEDRTSDDAKDDAFSESPDMSPENVSTIISNWSKLPKANQELLLSCVESPQMKK